MNHAMTGYACFLSCQNLRKTSIEFIQNLQKKPQIKCKLSTLESITVNLK